MFLEQICPGQANSYPHALHTFSFEQDRFVIYATGSKIVIYADPNKLIQTVVAENLFALSKETESITSVAGNSATGQIALSYHSQVAILKPEKDKEQIKWHLESVLETSFTVNCLDWSVHNILLVAGIDIVLWKYDQDTSNWMIQYQTKPANEIMFAKFEPKTDMFATIGKFDRLVTIWYPASAIDNHSNYNCTFIPHPKYVTHFAWRQLPSGNKTKENDCTLFTMARDGIGRFWSPTDLNQPHMLYMCAVIDSNQSLVTSEQEQTDRDHMNEDSDFSPIHYIGCDELSSAVNIQFRSHSKHERFDQRVERIRDRVRDTPDLLFRIQADGSLTLWGVQHLNAIPRRIPRVYVVLRVDRVIDPLDAIYFLSPTLILHDYGHIQSSSTVKPIELSLVARNLYGQVRCYSLNLIDFLDSTSFSAKLHLKYTWLGHQHSIVKLYQTEKNRFCTIGIDGQMNIWKYELRESYGKMTTQLQLDCSLFIDSNKLLAVPIDKNKYLAVYDGHHVKLYEFGQQDCHLYQSRTLTPEGVNDEISFLHVYKVEDAETYEKSFLLIAVSSVSRTLLTWHLVCKDDQLDVTFLGDKEAPWQSNPTFIESTSQWATNTASKLLYRLSMHKRIAFVVLIDNALSFYSLNVVDGETEWITLFTLDTLGLELPLQSVKCAPGVMAIVSGEKANTLSIWTEMRSGTPPELNKIITFDQPIKDLVWNVTSDAQYLLAIGFSKQIEIFGQKRTLGLNAAEEGWACYTKFQVDTPKDITALAWVDCGVLIAAAGNQLFSYLKWLTEDDNVNSSVQPYKTSKMEPMTSIFDISYEMNGPLPFYHPQHLVHYTMWGKMDLVHNILLLLYNFLKQFVDDEDNVISEFPTMSLPTILKLQNEQERQSKQKGGYDGLFSDSSDESNDEDGDFNRHMTLNEAKNLVYSLKPKSLPGINDKEKAHLIAMINTIAEITSQGESLDENGVRFIALLENHFHLKQVLVDEIDLTPKDYIWALHSQSQDLLLERCGRLCQDRFLWKDARSLGIFMWLQKIDVVREQMSQIARNTYLSKTDDRDPVDCTLFYFALRKKNLVQGLWNTASHHKEQGIMKKFLANDFNEPRWQRAASKNAYALLGKQRFEYAAAFFLLADKLKDAVNVILKNMKDYQLAIAICRVYEGDHSLLLKDILENSVIPVAVETNDCWLASIAFWLLNKQKEAVRSIIVPLSQFSEKNVDTSHADSAATVQNPNSFILYHHLKSSLQQSDIISYDIEYMFYLQVAQSYERLGCPLLALYVLTKYHMSPPTITKPSTEEEKKKGTIVGSDRAEDLFASFPPQKPSFASDIFADTEDTLFEPSKPSYASNLFDEDEDDIFSSTKKAASDNLFDEEETHTCPSKDDQAIEEEMDYEYDGLDVYKATLVIRMLQTFFHAASALYNGSGEISKVHETTYRNNFISNRNALLNLGTSLKIPADILSRLLMEKSIEMDVFPLYLHILNEQVPENFDVHQFLRAFKVGCFEVNEVALMPQELDYATLVFVENWSSHVLKTFPIWSDLRSRYCNPETASLTTHQIILTTYIGTILITLRERYYEKAWTLLCHFKFFLEALGSTDSLTAIKNCLDLLLKDEVRMAEIAPDEFESFSDESMFGYDMHEEVYRPLIDSQDKAAGCNILEIASLNFVLSSLEHSMQCQGRHNSLSEKLSDYTWTTLLDPIAYRTHCLKQTVVQQLEDNIARHNVMKQFKTLRQKKFWRSIKSLSTLDRLLPFIDSSPPSINVLPIGDRLDYCRNVYHSASTVYGFCLNPSVRDTMAICMKSEIQEIDLTKSSDNTGAPLIRARSVSSFGLGQDHHIDSYPDTEEDDSDFEDNESLHAGITTIKQTRRNKLPSSSRISGNNSPIVSPAGSRTFDEHVQKGLQNLNLDYLQDSLKKPLPKGAEIGRTPIATSPAAFDNTERENMISLRRPVVASCAETHPQYPFYITGCEGNNGGPSAILWQFGQEKEIASYYGCKDKTTRIHFDQFGQKFGAADASGYLCLWRFDAHAHSNKAYYTLQCHSKATRDFVFVNSSSLIATAGTSATMTRKRDHVVLWDTLLPASKAMVCTLPGHDAGAYAIAYEPNNQLLFSGGKKGEIVVSDLRQRTTMHTFTAHHSRIRSIAVDSENKSLITGSIDGELKIWDSSTYKLHQTFDIQPRNRFLAPSFNRIPLKAFGVTQIQVLSNDSNIYTSGPNGIIKCNRTPCV